jgi:hypothetical protein
VPKGRKQRGFAGKNPQCVYIAHDRDPNMTHLLIRRTSLLSAHQDILKSAQFWFTFRPPKRGGEDYSTGLGQRFQGQTVITLGPLQKE